MIHTLDQANTLMQSTAMIAFGISNPPNPRPLIPVSPFSIPQNPDQAIETSNPDEAPETSNPDEVVEPSNPDEDIETNGTLAYEKC